MARNDPLPLSQLRIPEADKMAAVIGALSDQGRADFLSELYGAIEDAKATNDHSPVQFVIDAWWVSGKFVRHEGFTAAVAAADRSASTDKKYTPAELSSFLTPV